MHDVCPCFFSCVRSPISARMHVAVPFRVSVPSDWNVVLFVGVPIVSVFVCVVYAVF